MARLFGEGISADHFNDDSLGRCLDKIYDYGVDKLFSELAFDIGAEQNLFGRSAHIDTTSLSMHGEYDDPSLDLVEQVDGAMSTGSVKASASQQKACPTITYGFSKDHRPDLKQLVLNLATTGAAGFPIWMEAHSGNASDQKELRAAAERMQEFCKGLEHAPSFMYVADSAMYESCIKKGGDLLWLSRVPERLKWAKELLQVKDEGYAWLPLEHGYRMCMIETNNQGVQQRLCIVSSEQAYHREIKTFEKRLKKQFAEHEKALWHLSNKVFGCAKDAQIAVKALNKKMTYHQAEISIVPVEKHAGKGRPKKEDIAETVGYKITGSIVEQDDIIEKTRRQKGRFLLATNELDRTALPDNEILAEYKEQSKTESGFRFIKDNTFEVSSIFLKKPSRIAALMMIMTLCLMVYSVAQHTFRESLRDVDLQDFDPDNKLTKKPTMKRVFKLFFGVHELTVNLGNDHVQCLIINLSVLAKKIVRCFGPKAMAIYALSG